MRNTTTYPPFGPELEPNSINVKLRTLYKDFGVPVLEFEKPDVRALSRQDCVGALETLSGHPLLVKFTPLAIGSTGFVTLLSNRQGHQAAEIHFPLFCGFRHLYKGLVKFDLAWPTGHTSAVSPFAMVHIKQDVLKKAVFKNGCYWIEQPDLIADGDLLNPFHYAEAILPESLKQPGSSRE